jgi:hypothetical protein
MARSRKTTFRKKTQRKVRKSRKQRGGENNLTWPLDEGDRVFPDGNYEGHKILWTEEPVNIPGFEGTYIGEYYLDNNGEAIMQGHGRFVYNDENPANGMRTIYNGYWNKNKKHGAIDFEYRNGDNGYAEFTDDVLDGPDKWHFAPTYNYADGNVYEGELVIKNGKAVPVDYDKVKPRTVFNFAPGPADFLDSKGDYIQLDKREAERGFRMSQDPDFVPRAPPNSPQREPMVVHRGPGIRGRLSGIRDSRLTSVEDSPMDRQQELEDVRRITSMQTGLKPLQGFERKSVLPSITTRKGGKYRKHKKSNKKGKKTRKNRRKH